MNYTFYCPNCKGIISSNDKDCPHCGQSFDNTAVRYKAVDPIFYKNRKLGSGIFYIIICLFLFAVGVYFISKVSLPLGIITIGIGGLNGLFAGRSIIGTKMGNCPHCGCLLVLNSEKSHFNCPMCKRIVIMQRKSIETPMYEVEGDKIASIISLAKPEVILSMQTTFSSSTPNYSYSRYFQKWDENYNKDLGYEWFRICVEFVNFPIYNKLEQRLINIRKELKINQSTAAQLIGISASTLSSYENGHTSPNDLICSSMSSVYNVPISFLKYGYGCDFPETLKLCKKFNEEEYIHNLCLSVRAASRLFPEMLTEDDKDICREIDKLFNLNTELFSEQTLKNEMIISQIKEDIINKLKEQELIQSKLWANYGENGNLARIAVKQLFESGVIEKEKYKGTYILRLVTKE